jgi:hypothetical protein
MALVDPNIAMGYRGVEIPNQLAQYGQLSAIQNAQNQNALAQYQLSAAQRADEQQTNLYSAAKQPNFKLDFQTAIQYGAPGIAAYKAQQESSKTQGEINAQDRKAALDRADAFSTALAPLVTNVQAGKPLTHNDVFAQANRLVAQGLLRKEDLGSIPMNAAELPNFVMNMATSTENSRKALQTYMPKVARQDTGGAITSFQDNPMLPNYGMPVAGMAIAKTPTFGETTAQGQLGLAQQKFAWEKANPGFELKEADDGSIVGVNKRTLQAFPVTVGNAAPAVAPMAGAGMPGARLPAVPVQAIPGMASVLDQQAPAVASAAGMPLRGKGTALTETQSNATAFGMRMKEANSILTSLEKAGVKNTGLISGVAGSVVGVIPLIGDKLTGMTESVFNVLPGIMGGLSPEQQQVAQARLNFITANLRKESGATLLPSEFITEEKKYFPKPGDDATVIAQKQKARNLALKAMEIQAGPGAKNIQQYQTDSGGAPAAAGGGGIPGATATNPLGLNIPGVK